MSRGKNNSTDTRVTPVFSELLRRKCEGRTWLPALLALPMRERASTIRAATPPIIAPVRFGRNEVRLKPPIELLRFLVNNPTRLRPPVKETTSAATREKRKALLSANPKAVREEALALLGRRVAEKAWYVLEGPTQPDVYIETEDAVVVIEGKRTERDATTTTTWMAERDQMLRHLDGAWEIRGNRRVYGFYIVEDDPAEGPDVPAHWQGVCAKTIASRTLSASLPHRSAAEQRAIASSFLGATTWSRVRSALDLPAFPDRP